VTSRFYSSRSPGEQGETNVDAVTREGAFEERLQELEVKDRTARTLMRVKDKLSGRIFLEMQRGRAPKEEQEELLGLMVIDSSVLLQILFEEPRAEEAAYSPGPDHQVWIHG